MKSIKKILMMFFSVSLFIVAGLVLTNHQGAGLEMVQLSYVFLITVVILELWRMVIEKE